MDVLVIRKLDPYVHYICHVDWIYVAKFYVGDAILCIKIRHLKSLPLSQKLNLNCKQRGKSKSQNQVFPVLLNSDWRCEPPNIYAYAQNNVVLKITPPIMCLLKKMHTNDVNYYVISANPRIYYTYFILAPRPLAEEYNFHSPCHFSISAGSFE